MRGVLKGFSAPALLLFAAAVLMIGFQNCGQAMSGDGSSDASSLGTLSTPTPTPEPTATPAPTATPMPSATPSPSPSPSPTPGPTPIELTISANANNVNLFTLAGSPTKAVTVTVAIKAGVRVGSVGPGLPALATGTFAAGSQIVIANAGDILGAGGSGGGGGALGGYGGAAITLNTPTIISNTGHIFGGGGGGGGGFTISIFFAPPIGGNGCGFNFGSLTTATVGGAPSGYVLGYTGDGGAGGCWGQPGATGSAAGGGAAGPAVVTNGVSLRWTAGGTAPALLGAIK